jgi:hypothetical protein
MFVSFHIGNNNLALASLVLYRTGVVVVYHIKRFACEAIYSNEPAAQSHRKLMPNEYTYVCVCWCVCAGFINYFAEIHCSTFGTKVYYNSTNNNNKNSNCKISDNKVLQKQYVFP